MTRIFHKLRQPRNGATETQYAAWIEEQRQQAARELPVIIGVACFTIGMFCLLMWEMFHFIAR